MSITSSMTRRQLLRAGALCVAAQFAFRPSSLLGQAPAATDAPPAGQGRGSALYSFVLLGDIHFDAPEHHDMDWVRKEKPNDIRQIENYCKLSVEHTPRLIQRVKQMVQQTTVAMPFVIQNGDLIEGLCGSFELQSKQMRDAQALIERAELSVPFLVNKGNHDITGPGGNEAYDQVMVPWIARQAGEPVTQAAYMRRHRDDLFVFFDSYKPNLDWLEGGLKEHRDARQTFFFTHPPVVPADARADWGIYGKLREAPSRQRLLNILGARQAVVFSAHLHKNSFLERETSNGRFWEIGTCSVVRSNPQPSKVLVDGAADYGEQLTDLEPKFNPATLDERKQILREEQPHVRQYSLADAPGCTLVTVYRDGISTQAFAGMDTTPWDTREVKIEVHA